LARKHGQPHLAEDSGGVGLGTLQHTLQFDPALALEQASAALYEARGSNAIALILDVWARSHRALGSSSYASVGFGTALSLDGLSEKNRAFLLQGAAAVLKNRAEIGWASAVFQKAIASYYSRGEMNNAGETLVEFSTVPQKEDSFEQAERLCVAGQAIGYLRPIFAVAAWQGRICCRICRDDPARAEKYFSELNKIHVKSRMSKGVTFGLRGDLYRSVGDFHAARSQYEDAIFEISPWPYQSLQVAVRLVASTLQAGDTVGAVALGASLESYLEDLGSKSPVVDPGIREVVASSRASRLGLAQLEMLIREVDRA